MPTTLEKRLLLAAVRDLEYLREDKPIPGHPRSRNCVWRAPEVELAREGLVKLDAARWLGQQLDGAGRVAVSRAYARLAKRGLAEPACVGWAEQRANYLLITDAGRELATKWLAVGEASDEAVGQR